MSSSETSEEHDDDNAAGISLASIGRPSCAAWPTTAAAPSKMLKCCRCAVLCAQREGVVSRPPGPCAAVFSTLAASITASLNMAFFIIDQRDGIVCASHVQRVYMVGSHGHVAGCCMEAWYIATRQRSPLLKDMPASTRYYPRRQPPITARLQPPLHTRLRSASPAASRGFVFHHDNGIDIFIYILLTRDAAHQTLPVRTRIHHSSGSQRTHASVRRKLMAVDLHAAPS